VSKRSDAYASYLVDVYRSYDALISPAAVISQLDFASDDIESLVLLVMMEAAKDEQQALRDIMDEIKAANQVRSRMRDAIAKLRKELQTDTERERDEYDQMKESDQRPCGRLDPDLTIQLLMTIAAHQSEREVQTLADELTITREHARRTKQVDGASDKLDALGELSEMESMRLQMMLDRRSKFIEALSNIKKRIAETNDAIVQNLK
jgi:hypothetical protein